MLTAHTHCRRVARRNAESESPLVSEPLQPSTGPDNGRELLTQQSRAPTVHKPEVRCQCQPTLRQNSGHQILLNLPQLLTLDCSRPSGIGLISAITDICHNGSRSRIWCCVPRGLCCHSRDVNTHPRATHKGIDACRERALK